MRKLLVVCCLALATLGVSPASRAQFCPGVTPWVFDDVLASDPFCGFVTWMAQENVTQGCAVIDGNHRLYCPGDTVTRKQMAAFLFRLGESMFPSTCAAGQVMKWDGTQWACASDATAGGGGGGTVTSVTTGTGLQGAPNPITGTGTLAVAATYRLPQACAASQVPKWNGSAWACAADLAGSGTVTSVTAGTGLTGGTITGSGTVAADTTYLQRRVSSTCAVGSSIRAIAADGTVTCQTDNAGPGNAFVQNGNAFIGEAVLGTTNAAGALNLIAAGSRVMRYEPDAISPNVIGGSPANSVTPDVRGATIAGGGVPVGTDPNFDSEFPNRVTDAYGTIGGGYANQAGDDAGNALDKPFATVAGGFNNAARGRYSTVAGGGTNSANGRQSTIGGGSFNEAEGISSVVGGGESNKATAVDSTIGGGASNRAEATYSSVAGGNDNLASGIFSTVGGGQENRAEGTAATVPGGSQNQAKGNYSVAMGLGAVVNGSGSFLFADASSFIAPVVSSTPNEFAVAATGGIAMGTTRTFSNVCRLAPGGGSWACTSDRAVKRDFASVDTNSILQKVVELPLMTWRFKTQPENVRHLGPMAQDFRAAFGLGTDDKTITQVDINGVALAAIQGLHRLVQEKDARIAALESRLAGVEMMRGEMAALRSTLATLIEERRAVAQAPR